jgi:hypothetical protein
VKVFFRLRLQNLFPGVHPQTGARVEAHDLFLCKMKNKNISDDEYNVCANAWSDNNTKTFNDFHEWYNNCTKIRNKTYLKIWFHCLD